MAVPLDTLDSYGRMISCYHKLGFVPFYYSKSKREFMVRSQQRRKRSAHVLIDPEESGTIQVTLSAWLILAIYTSYVIFNSSKGLRVLSNPKVHALSRAFEVFYTSLL